METIIKVRISNNVDMKEIMVSTSTTVEDAFKQADLEYTGATIIIDGIALPAQKFKNTFEELNIREDCTLAAVVKTNNA